MPRVIVSEEHMLATFKMCLKNTEKLNRLAKEFLPATVDEIEQLRQLQLDCHDAIYTLQRKAKLRSAKWKGRTPGEVAYEAFCSRIGDGRWDKMTDAMKADWHAVGVALTEAENPLPKAASRAS